MRTAGEDAEVSRLLRELDRIRLRLEELGVDLSARDRANVAWHSRDHDEPGPVVA